MKSSLLWSVFFAVLFLVPYSQSSAQEKHMYDEGTVWTMTFIRTAPNQSDTYLNDLAKTWVSTMELAKAGGLIADYKILQGNASNGDDYNLILMTENNKMADMDPSPDSQAKWDAIDKYMRDAMGDKYDMTVKNYDNIRTMMGTKVMRELHLKK